ncbi:MAG: hypothetical protein ACREJ0_09505 [Geminicoccaceae bacterium]
MGSERIDSGIERAIERFPELEASIRDRFHDDPSFREMCGDYAEALEALQRWQVSDVPQKAARVEEYRELAKALEIEIVTALRLPSRGAG